MNRPRNLITLVNLLLLYTEIAAFTPCQESLLKVRYVTSCPTDEVSWSERAEKMNCDSITQNCAMSLGLDTKNHRFQYHCLINSHRNATLEVCALSRYILGFCAEFNTNGVLVQEHFDANCKQHNPPCPPYYHSAKAYRYQSCYELVYKIRKIQKNKWIAGEIDLAEENVDYTDEIGASEEIDAAAEEINEAVLRVPTSTSNCLTGNRLVLVLLICLLLIPMM